MPVGTPFLADLYGSMEGLELSKTTADFSHDVACTAPSNIMKVSQQGDSFLLSSGLISHPATKVFGVFSNSVLPSSYGVQPRAMAIAYIVRGTAGASLTNCSQGDILHLVRPSFNNSRLLGAVLVTHVGTSVQIPF